MPRPQNLINHGRIPSICGQPANFQSSLQLYRWKRVQGGHKVQPYSVPWLGQVLKGTFNICGTTLIAGWSMSQGSTTWALSAAHCFKTKMDVVSLKVDVEDFSFIFGVYDLRYPTPHIVIRKARNIIIHHEYNFRNNDIAVIKFDRRLFFTDFVRPVCLPSSETRSDLSVDCVSCGYGRSHDDESPDIPACILRNFVTGSTITEVAIDVNPERISMSYSHNLFRAGISFGDSGGPFTCTYNGWNNVLIGIVDSMLKGYIHDQLAAVNLYAHVPFYVQWIEEVMNAPEKSSLSDMTISNRHNMRACWRSFAKSCSDNQPSSSQEP